MGTSSQSRALFQPRFTDTARGLFYYYSSLTGADWTTVTAVSLPRNRARSSRRLSSPYVQAWLRQLITQSRPGFAGKEVSSPAQEARSLIAGCDTVTYPPVLGGRADLRLLSATSTSSHADVTGRRMPASTPGRTRTCNQQLWRLPLCQLSYGRDVTTEGKSVANRKRRRRMSAPPSP